MTTHPTTPTPTDLPEALRLADAIDPFTRRTAPDHLTSKVAADELRRLHAALRAAAPAVAPQAGAESYPPDWEALRHSANEWADMATNGLQWLRNIVSGASDAAAALQNMESNLAHCRAVNDAPAVQHAVRTAAALRARGAVPSGIFDLEDVDLPDAEDMAHSVLQEAFSFGLNHDVIHRGMRHIQDKTVKAMLAAAPQPPAALPGEQDAARYQHVSDDRRTFAVCVWHNTPGQWRPFASKEAADYAIDAAMATAKGRTDGGEPA